MEKLLELLKEYIRQKFEFWEYWVYINKQNKLILEKQHSFMGYWIDEEWYQDEEFWESIIISKQFEFIKWLVEKDLIDRSWMEYSCCIKKNNKVIHTEHIDKSDLLIMFLSVQNDPIHVLISYLK